MNKRLEGLLSLSLGWLLIGTLFIHRQAMILAPYYMAMQAGWDAFYHDHLLLWEFRADLFFAAPLIVVLILIVFRDRKHL